MTKKHKVDAETVSAPADNPSENPIAKPDEVVVEQLEAQDKREYTDGSEQVQPQSPQASSDNPGQVPAEPSPDQQALMRQSPALGQEQRGEIPSDPADYLGTNGHAMAQVENPDHVNPLTATVPEGSTELELDDRQPAPAVAGADRATDEADGKPEPVALKLDDGEANTGSDSSKSSQVHEGWDEVTEGSQIWKHQVTDKFTFSLADGKLDNMRYDTLEDAFQAQLKYAGQQ